MASKSGKHYKKSSKSSKKGFKKTTGGASYRNYSKKSKNLDYKYRILDIADTNQSAWYEQAASKYKEVASSWYDGIVRKLPSGNLKNGWVSNKEQNIAALVQGYYKVINTMCHFIPVSTSQMVAKNISLEVRCKYPFAYCLFQNTKQFRDVFVKIMTANMSGTVSSVVTDLFKGTIKYLDESPSVSNETLLEVRELMSMIYTPTCFNPFGLDDSGFVLPMLNNSCEDYDNLSTNLSPTSAMWGQICRAQSSYREIRSANNAGEYYSTINAYYSKASTYLTTSSAKDPYTIGYKKGNIVREHAYDYNNFAALALCPDTKQLFGVEISKFVETRRRTQNYETIFNSGDIIVCILPCWYINSVNPQAQGQVSRPPIDSSQVMRDAIPSINMVRHYYVLNQDTGIKEVLNNDTSAADAVVITQLEKSVANVPTSNNSGNTGQYTTNGLFRNLMLSSQGVQVHPILRADLDDTAQKTNCVVVDEKCYDEETQELEMQAYMDLQPVPANAGNNVLEDVEGEDTMNCNAIVSCGNKTDSETCLDASVSNTGPQVYSTTDNSITLYGISESTNFGYGYDELGTYQRQAQEQAEPFVIAPSPGNYFQTSQQFTTYSINTSALQQLVNFVNQFINFKLIIPAFYQNSIQTNFSYFSFNPQYPTEQPTKLGYDFGYQPDGTSNNTYLQLILPFGFGQYQPSGYSTAQPCCMWAVPCLSILKDGEQATGSISITPLAFEAIQNLLIRKLIQTEDSVGAVLQTYDLSEVCGISYNDSNDPAYGPTGSPLHPVDINNYMTMWMQQYISATGASKVWKKIKGFFCKVGKFIKDKALPFIKKIANKVGPKVPAPYGTIITAVGTGVDLIQSTINVIGAKKTKTDSSQAAVQDDTVTDYFTVIPQYRLASSDDPARIEDDGTDWVDGDVIQVPVDQYGQSVTHLCVHKLVNHPQYFQIRNALQGTRVQGLDIGAFCQQRLKVIFRKTGVSPAVARGYKALMMLGSDTQYINSSTDFQTVQTDSSIQNQQ